MKKFLLIIVGLISISLKAQTAIAPNAGDGTIENPYQIATLENLYWIAVDNSRWNKNYIQIANINAAATSTWDGGGWVSIGDAGTKFTGRYNGNGHIIDSIYINRGGDHQGLFGYTNGAIITDLGVTNVNMNIYRRAGAIVGSFESNSVMDKCYSTGTISGSFIIGSLVGLSQYSIITNCYSRGSVSGETTIGGLLGYNYTGSILSNCYSAASVAGSHSTIGGLVGYNWNASITNSFWDTETSGQLISAGGIGKTTAEMKTQSTYTNAGWDFTTVWKMYISANDGYPFLKWQDFPPQPYPPSAGDGTIGNPYQIANLGNLYWIALDASRWDKHYLQIADIDASETAYWFSNASGGYYGWTPIGSSSIQFSGNYNGDGYSIDGLYINRTIEDYQGLFGYTNGATISKLGVINVNITGYYYVGGLVGENYSSILNNCYSTGNISGYIYVGGLVGRNNNNSTISNSYSTGGVECDYYYAGGLLGANFNTSRVENSYSTGNVTTTSNNVGGLIGANFYSSIVENCYSKGNVSGQFTVGGLMGYNYQSTINNSYSTGTATGSGTVGGCVARNEATLNNCYWDTETSGQTTSSGGTGKTTAEMKTQTTYTNTGWDFTTVWQMNTTANDGYPFLIWQSFSPQAYAPSAGDGTIGNPYQIANLGNLYWIASDASRWDKHYLQIADIDASETAYWSDGGWKKIGTELTNFTGTYNGNQHIIDGLTINHELIPLYEYEGLFGWVVSSTISNLGLTNVDITSYFNVGALGGAIINSTISNCFSTGNITGQTGIGGLIGVGSSNIVKNCYTRSVVNGQAVVGGLIANNEYSTVTNCYSASIVNGSSTQMIGGLMGHNSQSVVNNCFWDIEISGQLNSAAGIGKTTIEMKIDTTFLNAGWDPQIWNIGDGINDGYTYLAWQNPGGTSIFQTPILAEPLNNSTAISPDPTLSWYSVPGADNYKLEVNTQPDFGGTIIFDADTLTDTTHTIAGLLNNTRYYWRIRAINNFGFSSDSSSTYNFTTIMAAKVEVTFSITDGAGGTTILKAGLDSLATDGLDAAYGESELTSVPPAGNFDARFNFPDSLTASLIDIRQGTFQEGFNRIHEIQFQVGAGTSIIINYDFGEYTSDKVRARLQDVVTGELIDTTIYGSGSYMVSDPTVYNRLKLTMLYDTSIPVELTSFNASSIAKDVNLKWSTSSETNNSGYQIERKIKNENNWSTVTFINGRGTTTELTNYTFTDKNVPSGIYNYRLKQIDFDGSYDYSNIIEVEVNAPKDFALEQNYPNPFNPSTIINFEIPAQTNVLLIVYDLLGNEITTLVNEEKPVGSYKIEFDASSLSNGVYFYRLKAGDFVQTRKMILLK